MSRKLPRLNSIRAFEAAARHVSFTKAGEELHVTHAAVSRHVAMLEDWLGRPLFHRSASLLTLTDAGRRYLPDVTAALDRLSIASISLMEDDQPFALRINAPPTFTMRWLIPRMAGFQRRRPDVELRPSASLAPISSLGNAYDIAIRPGRVPPPGDGWVPFMNDIIAPVCHPDMMEGRTLMEPAELRSHTLISYETLPYLWKDWLEAAGVPDLQPANMLKLEQLYFALQAAAEGLGIVLMPFFLAVDDVVSGRLALPFGLSHVQHLSYYAHLSETAKPNPVARSFFEWLQQEALSTEQAVAEWAESQGWRG